MRPIVNFDQVHIFDVTEGYKTIENFVRMAKHSPISPYIVYQWSVLQKQVANQRKYVELQWPDVLRLPPSHFYKTVPVVILSRSKKGKKEVKRN